MTVSFLRSSLTYIVSKMPRRAGALTPLRSCVTSGDSVGSGAERPHTCRGKYVFMNCDQEGNQVFIINQSIHIYESEKW